MSNERPWAIDLLLGLEVHQSLKGYLVNQRKYASDLNQLANLTDTKQVDTSMKLNFKYSKDDSELLNDAALCHNLLAASSIILWQGPTLPMRFNYLVSSFLLSYFHRIISYLRGTLSQGLFFSV